MVMVYKSFREKQRSRDHGEILQSSTIVSVMVGWARCRTHQ